MPTRLDPTASSKQDVIKPCTVDNCLGVKILDFRLVSLIFGAASFPPFAGGPVVLADGDMFFAECVDTNNRSMERRCLI